MLIPSTSVGMGCGMSDHSNALVLLLSASALSSLHVSTKILGKNHTCQSFGPLDYLGLQTSLYIQLPEFWPTSIEKVVLRAMYCRLIRYSYDFSKYFVSNKLDGILGLAAQRLN